MKKKWLSRSLLISSTVGILAPTTCLLVSCQEKEHEYIKSITLSLKPDYVSPGKTVAVRKKIYPYAATNNPLKWEILDSPFEGIEITQDGKITVPRSIKITDPKIMHIRATDLDDPEIYDDLAIAIINEPEADQKFIGFADNKITYKNVDGESASVKIIKNDNNLYTVEHPIDLFEGRPFENIEFLPIVGKGYNTKMQLHLHGEDTKTLRALSWVGYLDNSWTEEIPTFKVTFIEHLHDVMEVKFACDETVTLRIDFNVYQSPEKYTPPEMAYYDPDSYHTIEPTVMQSYTSQIKLPIHHAESPTIRHDVMENVFVYRKPYEYLDDLSFSFVLAEGITEDMISCEITSEKEIVWREYDDYKVLALTLDFTIDLSKFDAKDYDYETAEILTFHVSDTHAQNTYCTFYALWDDIKEAQ